MFYSSAGMIGLSTTVITCTRYLKYFANIITIWTFWQLFQNPRGNYDSLGVERTLPCHCITNCGGGCLHIIIAAMTLAFERTLTCVYQRIWEALMGLTRTSPQIQSKQQQKKDKKHDVFFEHHTLKIPGQTTNPYSVPCWPRNWVVNNLKGCPHYF